MFSPTPRRNFNSNNPVPDNVVNLELVKAADSINKNSLVWIDSMTEFLRAQSLPNKILQYNYAVKIDTNKYDIRKLRELSRKGIFDRFIMTPACKVFRDNNVTIIYNYTDMKNESLYKLVFSPDTYKK
jgi:hypothetical protein